MKDNGFKNEFIRICNKRWIKGVNNNCSSVGLTFENELGKKADSMFFPDYYGLEIKCSTRFSKYPINLFSIAFDGPNLYETNILLQKYGKIDYKYKDRKTLMGLLNTQYPVKLSKYSFMLDADKRDKKLYLCVFDENECLVEREAYIEFDTIISRLKLKLSNLAIVYASKKSKEDNFYFRYYAYKKYILREYVDLYELIDEGIIKIYIMCRVSRSGTEEGRQRNKSLMFQIDKDKIDYLFKCIEQYDNDL